MDAHKSQAMTEMFNMKTSLKSMSGKPSQPSNEAVVNPLSKNDAHPMDACRQPELFSELCC